MEFSEGQIWKIRTGEFADTEIYLHKVLSHDLVGNSFHISVPSEGVSHMPFSEKALEESDLDFLVLAPNLGDDWKEGFGLWHEEFLNGRAGVFSVTVSEAINFLFDTRDTGEDVGAIE